MASRTERQAEAIEKWKAAKCKGTWVFPTGFGKTRTAMTAIARVLSKNPNMRVTVVVPTAVLKRQWQKQLTEYDLPEVQVMIINTAAKKPFDCDFLVLDECQHYSSDKFAMVFHMCKPYFILGLTATYERLDAKERLVLDKICPVCDTVTVQEALENHWLSEYREYKVMIDIDLTEYEKANQAFLSHMAYFDFDFDLIYGKGTGLLGNPVKQATYAKKRNVPLKELQGHIFGLNKALQTRKAIINRCTKKLEVAQHILDMRPQSKAITFNGSIEDCNFYKSGYKVSSKTNKKDLEKIIEEFEHAGPGSQIHSVDMLKEGLDVKGLDLAITVSANSSKIKAAQSLGRVIRFEPGKTAEMFTLVLAGTQDEKWFAKSHEGKPFIPINEEELEIVLSEGSIDKKERIQETQKYNFRY